MTSTRSKILTAMGIIMLVGIVILGYFGFPIGILLCAITGLCYGIYKKDWLFFRWSAVAFILDISFIIYCCMQIQYMN